MDTVPTGTTQPLYALWGRGADDVWSAGHEGTIVHWDGRAWSSEQSGTEGELFGLWGSDAGELWVVGEGGAVLRRQR
jgi:hypothetical protein